MSKEVKRYDYGYVDDGNGNRYLGLIEKPDGNLVKHEDYKALLAERDRLAAENERLGRDAKNDAIAYRAVIARQEELRSELEALKKDAERYRFLMRELGGSVSQVVMGSPVFSNEDVDAAIDAALQGAQPCSQR